MTHLSKSIFISILASILTYSLTAQDPLLMKRALLKPINATYIDNDPLVEVSISADHLELKKHNNDCHRLQGGILAKVYDKKTKIHCKLKNAEYACDTVVTFHGNKKTNFAFRKLPESNMTCEVIYMVRKSTLENNNLAIRLYTQNLKGCHKGCDFCTDYHCNINYEGEKYLEQTSSLKRKEEHWGTYLEGTTYFKGKRNGKDTDHSFEIHVQAFYSMK